jgi:hypothetical protein
MSDSATTNNHAGNGTPKTRRPLWQRELFWAIGGAAFGLTALPVLIYIVGAKLLGEYAGGGTLASFFQHYFGNLLDGSLASWSIAIGPIVISAALRYSLTARFQSATPIDLQNTAQPTGNAQRNDHPARREPFIGS